MEAEKRLPVQIVNPISLNDLPARISYLKSFMDFNQDDGDAINSTKDLIAPLLPEILDAVYSKLLGYDITAKTFVPRNTGYSGQVAQNVAELSLSHPQIARRKDFLRGYLVKLVSNKDWDDYSSFWDYLNRVGIAHTGKPGLKHRENKPELRVEYLHLGLLLGYVVDIVVGAVMEADLETAKKEKAIKSFNKLIWIQNDLFARHYIIDPETTEKPKGIEAVKATLVNRPLSSLVLALTTGLSIGTVIALGLTRPKGN
ncbi:MAG: hypothetical protein M1834_000818 [Cirrosporium novae-zelandiae]|nr:MAG: hypothetical protein M1834_000818 [Cirrosporium novae-zelandiae]